MAAQSTDDRQERSLCPTADSRKGESSYDRNVAAKRSFSDAVAYNAVSKPEIKSELEAQRDCLKEQRHFSLMPEPKGIIAAISFAIWRKENCSQGADKKQPDRKRFPEKKAISRYARTCSFPSGEHSDTGFLSNLLWCSRICLSDGHSSKLTRICQPAFFVAGQTVAHEL